MCGHCKNLVPTYEQLADAFAHQSDKVIIAKTDADGVGKDLGRRYGVQGYPTLKWFPAGDSENPVDYTGGRDLDSLVDFVYKQSKVKSNIKPPPPPAALQLDADNFDKIVKKSGKDVLVAFTAPWCGYCKKMKPAYEKVAKAFKGESNCVVAEMNADDAMNKPIAAEYGVSSFPTIKFFPKDGSEPVPYSGGRDEQDFVEYLNEQCGSHRTITGLLSEKAGKLLHLDTLAATFFSSPAAQRLEILKRAQAYVAELTPTEANKTASYYIKAMEKVLGQGEDWLAKETARLAKLVSSPSLAPTKLDEIIVKKNILSSFVFRKLGDQASLASEAVVDATESVKSVAGEATEAAKQQVEHIRQEL